MNSASAVDELTRGRMGDLIAGDEREESDGLSCACGHFQEAMTSCVQCPFQFHHVLMLFWVNVLVREVYCHILDLELHGHRQIDRWTEKTKKGNEENRVCVSI